MIERVEIITADNFVTFENKINTCIIENLGNVRDIKFCVNADMIPGRGYYGRGYYAMIILGKDR